MSDDEEEVYCICRSTDVSRFMIGCDNCEEWYHGDCINVTEEEAGTIKKFFCHVCRKKNPSLEIKYKSKKVPSGSKTPKEKGKDECQKDPKGWDDDAKPAMDKPKGVKVKDDRPKEKHKEHSKDDKEKHKEKPKDKPREKPKEFSIKGFQMENKAKFEKQKEKHKGKLDLKSEEKTKEKMKAKLSEDKPKDKHIPKIPDKVFDSPKLKKDKHKEKDKDKGNHRDDKQKEKLNKDDNCKDKPSNKQDKVKVVAKPATPAPVSSKHVASSKGGSVGILASTGKSNDSSNREAARGRQRDGGKEGTGKDKARDASKEGTSKDKTRDASKDGTSREKSRDTVKEGANKEKTKESYKENGNKDKTRDLTKEEVSRDKGNDGGRAAVCQEKIRESGKEGSGSHKEKRLEESSLNRIATSAISQGKGGGAGAAPLAASPALPTPPKVTSNKAVSSSKVLTSASTKVEGTASGSSSDSPLLSKRLSVELSDVLGKGGRCGACEACRVTHDCGACDYCRRRSPSHNVCVKRRCRHLYQLSKRGSITTLASEKYRDDPKSPSASPPIPNTPKEGAATGDAPLKAGPPQQRPTALPDRPSVQPERPTPKVTPAAPAERRLPPPFPFTTVSLERVSSEDESEERPRSVLKDLNERNSDDDVWEPTKKLWDRTDNRTKTKQKKKKVAAGRGGGRKRKGRTDCPSGESDAEEGSNFGPKNQCQGPECVQPARPHSKYCCQECGLKLAEKRIFAILPQRIREWKLSGCTAEAHDTKKLEKIRRQQLQAQAELQRLEIKYQELERVVERGLQQTVDPQADEDVEDEGGEGQGVYCVTCGHEVATRRAIKHMENCFNKIESQTTFGSQYKTRIEGNTMFCDFYSASTRTYCKRLRVMCPEHYKEPKVPETRVCGAPLVRDVFTETGELCRASRKRCIKHYRWERLRRAEIDMERVRQWMKLDELLEQERHVRQSMTNRAGVLGLMLHSAFDHTLATRFEQQRLQQEKLQQQRQQQEQEQQRQQRLQQQQLQQQKLQQQKSTGLLLQQPPPTVKYRVISQQQPSDHRYYQGSEDRSKDGVRGPRPAQHTDHQYYRAVLTQQADPASPGHLKLKGALQKGVGGGPTTHKTIIHLHKSATGHPYMTQQTTRYTGPSNPRYYQANSGDQRFHQDHQYHHQAAPPQQYQRPAPPHSDHIYYTNKRPHK